MNTFSITGDHYLYPTPSGTYYAVNSPETEPYRLFLRRLLAEQETPQFTVDLIQEWTLMDEQDALEFVYRLQVSGFIQGLPMPLSVPEGNLETLLPVLLERLSDEGKAVVAEKRGLYLGSSGYSHETTEELAALGADLAVVRDRHRGLLNNNLRLPGGALGLVNASGSSEVGFWPIYFGNDYFILVIGGLPQFNQTAFTTLVWSLGVRYGGMVD